MKKVWLGIGLGVSFACAGLGGESAPSAPAAQIAFTTFSSGSETFRFKTDTTVEKSWGNMSGSRPQGTWTLKGDELHMVFDPKYTNHGLRESKSKIIDPCTFATHWWLDKDGKEHVDDSKIFQRKKPKCMTVQ